MQKLLREMLRALVATAALAVLVCGVYPLVVYGAGQLFFPRQANGSLLESRDRTLLGSSLIGQNFAGEQFFQPRPSAAGAGGYDAASSGGSNLGPTSQKLSDQVRARVAAYRQRNHLPENAPVPADAVTASASGLDPQISVKNARWQAPRVAQVRGLAPKAVEDLVAQHTTPAQFGLLGDPGVNVLTLNLALEEMLKGAGQK